MEGAQASWHGGNEIMLNLCRLGSRTGWVMFGGKETKEWKKNIDDPSEFSGYFVSVLTGKNSVYETGRNVID